MKLSVESSSARPLVACLLAATATLVPAVDAPAQTETVRLAGSTVAMYNLAGEVTLSPGTGSDVVVTVRKQGADGSRLAVESGPLEIRRGDRGEIETLRVIYPSNRIRYDGMRGRTTLRVRDDGTFWGGGDWRRRGAEVEISDRGDGLEASANLEVSVPRGRRVVVMQAAGAITARNVDGNLHMDTGSGAITTSATRGGLDLDTGSGDVTVDGAEGEVKVDTGSGTVEVRGVSGPDLLVDTGSGNVRVERVETADIEIDTGSGNVVLLGARTGDVGVDTGSGDVTVETVAGSASIHVDTGSGDVAVAVPSDYAGDVRIETSSGRMVTDLPITLLRRSDDEIVGRIGEGGSARIEIDTGSGDIRIDRS
ncbi:MAG: DUF4097 family beta strand repeat-containing protein [Gemmatimonadota bacterium]